MTETVNFYDAGVWKSILLIAILLSSLLLAHILKSWKPVKQSMIPNAVIGGIIILIISGICYTVTGDYLFNQDWLSENGSGMNVLEILTYHCLGVGFIALTLRDSDPAESKKVRTSEIINSGMLTVSTYLVQGILGIAVTIIAACFINGFVPGSGLLLCFGFGQGTGQALTQGVNFDTAAGTGEVYANIGLTFAASGFLIASLGGVIILNILRRKNMLPKYDIKKFNREDKLAEEAMKAEEMESNESVDKLSIQFALIFLCYVIAYGFMFVLGKLISGMIGTVFGFNFIFGVLAAVLVKWILKLLKKRGMIKKTYNNTFLLNRISGFAFDLMIVSGICAIQIHLLTSYIWLIVLIVALGAAGTFIYIWFVCRNIFPEYRHEQFFAFFGMLTGTASTGVILLREIDPRLESKASENLVYQNIPAIVFALPVLFITSQFYKSYDAVMSIPHAAILTAVVIVYFIILNIILFRSKIFKRKNRNAGK